MLKSIELIGFKSFAKKSVLTFESDITAIVGPNGSGKSNAAEGFRFVLGEQGSKSMRVKKGTDLIWGGSHSLSKGSRASVKVVLDNSAGKLSIDFDEVVIERTVLRDGANEYSINGSKVRLKDVQDVLAAAHIGSSGHHIISQGEADRVLGASAKERREMLEDALGLKAYQLKKAEAKRKLEATSLNLEKAESRRRELLPHLKFLSRQVKRVEQAQAQKAELKSKAAEYFASESKWISEQEQELQGVLPGIKQDKQELEQQVADLQQAIAGAKEFQNNDTEDNNQTQELQEQKTKLITLRSTLATLRTELGKVTGQLEMLQVVEQKAKELPSSMPRKQVKELLQQVNNILDSGDIEHAKVKITEFMEQYLTADAPQRVRDNSGLEQERNKLKSEYRELIEQVAGQEQAIAKQEQLISDIQIQIDNTKQVETEQERDLYKVIAEYNELKAQLETLERRKAEVSRRRDSLSENMAEVQILIGEEILGGSTAKFDNQPVPNRRDIERLKIQLEQHGNLGTEVLDEHKEAKEHHDFLTQEITDLETATGKLNALIEQLDKNMCEQFDNGLALINTQFNTFFNTLFDGGSAELALEQEKSRDEDSEPQQATRQEAGVEVKVSLQRKKVTTLETLSGGERALASIALIFAMSQVNPPPFIILDETDAALDEANSQRYAAIVQQLAQKSQIILITHNRATMAAASTLYGVTMGSDGMSQLLSVKLTDAEQFAK